MQLRCRNCKTPLNKETRIKHGFCCSHCKETYKEKKGDRTWILDILFGILEIIAPLIP